jgi:hypothetical protein
MILDMMDVSRRPLTLLSLLGDALAIWFVWLPPSDDVQDAFGSPRSDGGAVVANYPHPNPHSRQSCSSYEETIAPAVVVRRSSLVYGSDGLATAPSSSSFSSSSPSFSEVSAGRSRQSSADFAANAHVRFPSPSLGPVQSTSAPSPQYGFVSSGGSHSFSGGSFSLPGLPVPGGSSGAHMVPVSANLYPRNAYSIPDLTPPDERMESHDSDLSV